ncbi:VCBS repeat-containing protein, partial [Dolichospermum sp. ST_sed4]|nr:VCBS repeat-containing protein [Dolichospermum sp. ST_sed4]
MTKGSSSVAWGNYDNDNDLDVLIGSIIYRNNGDNSFSEQTGITLTGGGSCAWGDYENDGDFDVLRG